MYGLRCFVVLIVKCWFCQFQPPRVVSSNEDILLVAYLICVFLFTRIGCVVFNLEFQVSPPGGVAYVLYDAVSSFAHLMFGLGCPFWLCRFDLRFFKFLATRGR
jgi:hypothetical protein